MLGNIPACHKILVCLFVEYFSQSVAEMHLCTVAQDKHLKQPANGQRFYPSKKITKHLEVTPKKQRGPDFTERGVHYKNPGVAEISDCTAYDTVINHCCVMTYLLT